MFYLIFVLMKVILDQFVCVCERISQSVFYLISVHMKVILDLCVCACACVLVRSDPQKMINETLCICQHD